MTRAPLPRFSLRRVAPLALLALAGLAAVLTLPVAPQRAEAQFLSPGPLSQPHADIDGDTNCNKCHTGGRKVDDPKCLECHKDLGARIDAGKGLHGTASYKAKECSICHVEHIGRNAKLVRWPGGDKTKLDHAETGWKLEGAHAPLECAKCHDKKNERGNATFLGLSSTCVPCHTDPHDGSFGKNCLECHDQTEWKKVRMAGGAPGGFDHGKTAFPLKGKHKPVECKKCHTGDPPKWKGLAFDSCADCHADPHQGKLGPRCASCHTEESWGAAASRMRGNHPVLSLANGHAKVTCKKCHDRGNDKPPSKGKSCVSCHPKIHEAAFGDDCNRCHASIEWLGLPREIGLSSHKETTYPLKGRHEAVGCAKCHDPKKKPAARFRQLVFDRCAACHFDSHKGEFAIRNNKGECAVCHTVDGFMPTLFGPANHAKTVFPLEGRHAAVPCGGCHGAAPRLDLRNPKRKCAECHANPHGEQFAEEMKKGGCAECHNVEGWSRVKIDHSTWPLTGAHSETACSKCHDASPEDRKKGTGATWKGVPRECEGCHADVHAGQFRLGEPVRGCTDCHDTETYEVKDFDHAKKTRWPLDGKHVALTCDKCHAPEKVKGGLTAVRWRLGYQQCRDCHADPHQEAPR